MLSDHDLVEMFKALSDAHRLHLFELLLASDRTNSELMAETGLSQNLLSHHLTVLAEAGLITVQQSIGDARRRYYRPNLPRVRLLSERWRTQVPGLRPCVPVLAEPQRVLFLCYSNAARSLMAEAMANHLASGALVASSAGMKPGAPIPGLLLEVLRGHGVPVEELRVQTYDELAGQPVDYLITVCDRVHENTVPKVQEGTRYLHWSLHDPFDEAEDAAGQRAALEQLYDDLEQRLAFFVQRLTVREAPPGQS